MRLFTKKKIKKNKDSVILTQFTKNPNKYEEKYDSENPSTKKNIIILKGLGLCKYDPHF